MRQKDDDEERLERSIMAKNWIAGAIKKKGALHKELNVPMDKKIPSAKLKQATKAKGKLGKRARLAETLKKLHK
jgi:hypothetical protein